MLARKLEPVEVDRASNRRLFAEKARQLLAADKVTVVFGCWTPVSRKSALSVFKELNWVRGARRMRPAAPPHGRVVGARRELARPVLCRLHEPGLAVGRGEDRRAVPEFL